MQEGGDGEGWWEGREIGREDLRAKRKEGDKCGERRNGVHMV